MLYDVYREGSGLGWNRRLPATSDGISYALPNERRRRFILIPDGQGG